MGSININFEELKIRSVEETKVLFRKECPDIVIVLNKALLSKDEEILVAISIQETKHLYGDERQIVIIDLAKATRLINEEIEYYESRYLQRYIDLINAGETEAVIKECMTNFYDWIEDVDSTVSNSFGSRQNDIAFSGINETVNSFCLKTFLAYLNLTIKSKINNMVLLKSLQKDEIGHLHTDKDNPELGLMEIALYYHYNNLSLGDNNSDEVVKLFRKETKKNSGKVLMRHFNKIKKGGSSELVSHKNAVKNISNVLRLLTEEFAITLAQQDLITAQMKRN